TSIEPEPARDAAAAGKLLSVALARGTASRRGRLDRRVVVIAVFDRLDGFHHADAVVLNSVDPAGPFLRGVAKTEIGRVDAQFLAQFFEDRLDGKGGLRRSGSAVGVRPRLVDADVVAFDTSVGDVVAGEDAHATR